MNSMPDDSAQRKDGELSLRSDREDTINAELRKVATELLPRFGGEWNLHSLVTLKRQSLSRLIYYYELYKKVIDVPGVICEFGVQYGATLALLTNLRGMLEPYNYSRKIYGFDTFSGFAAISEKDGNVAKPGDYATEAGYAEILARILGYHESFSPLAHIKKYELIAGDATETVPRWLQSNPHAIISMAIFDMDVYAPTKAVLESVLPRLTKGSLLVFDELSCETFPGETVAVSEVLGISKLALRRFPHQPHCAWAIFEG